MVRFRGSGALALLLALLLTLTLASSACREKSGPAGWQELLVGPATGKNTRISPSSIDSEGIGLRALVSIAHGISSWRIVGPPLIDRERCSLLARSFSEDREQFRSLLRKLLEEKFNLVVHRETQLLPVYLLRQVAGVPVKLQVSTDADGLRVNEGTLVGQGRVSILLPPLEGRLSRPVLDETGLKESYKYDMTWEDGNRESLKAALAQQLGLQVVSEERRLEVLVVDRVEPLQTTR